MLEALAKNRVPGTPRENQYRLPSQKLHTLEATASRREEFLENGKLTLVKACLLPLDKRPLSFQERCLIVLRRGCLRSLMPSVTVPELISALLREFMVTSTLLSAAIPGGAESDVLQPPYYVTQFEECLQRLNVLACRGSDVFVAIMNETAAGMLAPFSS
ncbi:hypothetical protein V5799_018864 [Amblyomma americanum]|uniref:Uncharacterized protein n=1 Tax=Amblyomma americanum TaxID=6943 RepID=A0AAQ4EYJ7_AMBAM